MKNSYSLIKHLTGLLIFSIILFLAFLIEAADRIPFIGKKLPMRTVAVAKQDVTLYQCENFGERKQIAVLKTGEAVTLESVVCGDDTRWYVELSDGRKACYSARDEDKVERKLYRFYYF
jgi:competence protein ComGC